MIWKRLASLLGTLLVVAGLGGFAGLMTAPALTQHVSTWLEDIEDAPPPRAEVTSAVSTVPVRPAHAPITRLTIPGIGLDTPVVVAPLVDHDGSVTWDVPRFVAGHAEGTAGAGEAGNAIIIGHVTSITLGNVFEHLDRVAEGDFVLVYSSEKHLDYQVTAVGNVARTDVSVLEPTPSPSVTLITCSGWWLPTVGDYSQRLVVRGELRETRSTQP
jgi:LPXTG-site transpeptidase (sortase) family protein